jgi:hypothetical protein
VARWPVVAAVAVAAAGKMTPTAVHREELVGVVFVAATVRSSVVSTVRGSSAHRSAAEGSRLSAAGRGSRWGSSKLRQQDCSDCLA